MEIEKDDLETARSQMRKGLLEYCILLLISKDKVYANDILKKLKEVNLLVVEGTIYPLLSRLKNSGILTYTWEESPSGPPRKYYHLTAKGHTNLKKLNQAWEELSLSINDLKN